MRPAQPEAAQSSTTVAAALQGGPVAFVVEGRVPGRAEELVRHRNYETARTPRTLARAKIAAASISTTSTPPSR